MPSTTHDPVLTFHFIIFKLINPRVEALINLAQIEVVNRAELGFDQFRFFLLHFTIETRVLINSVFLLKHRVQVTEYYQIKELFRRNYCKRVIRSPQTEGRRFGDKIDVLPLRDEILHINI